MAVKFNDSSKIVMNGFSPTGDFAMATPPIQYTGEVCQIYRRRAALNDFIGLDTGGRVTASVSNIPLPTLTIPNLNVGDYIPSIELEMEDSFLTLSALGQTSNAVHTGGLIQFQDFGVGYTGIIDGGEFSMSGVGTNPRRFDFSAVAGSDLIDLEGNGNGTLQGFTTGGFIENVGAAPSQTKLRIATANNLPASGTFPVYIIRTDTNALIHSSNATFINGFTEVFFAASAVPVGTPVTWAFANGNSTLGANANANIIGG